MALLAHCQLWRRTRTSSPPLLPLPPFPALFITALAACATPIVKPEKERKTVRAERSLRLRPHTHSRNGARRRSLPRAALPPRGALRRRPEGRGTGRRAHHHHAHAGGSRQEDDRARRGSDHHARRRHPTGRSGSHHTRNPRPRRGATHQGHPGTSQGSRRGATHQGLLAPCPGAQGQHSAGRGARRRPSRSRRRGTRHHSHQARRPRARAGQEEEAILQEEEEEQGPGPRSRRRRGPHQVQEGQGPRGVRRLRSPWPRTRCCRRRHRGRDPEHGRKHHVGVRDGAGPRRPPRLDEQKAGERGRPAGRSGPVEARHEDTQSCGGRCTGPFGRAVCLCMPPHFVLSIFFSNWPDGPASPSCVVPLTSASDSFFLPPFLYQIDEI